MDDDPIGMREYLESRHRAMTEELDGARWRRRQIFLKLHSLRFWQLRKRARWHRMLRLLRNVETWIEQNTDALAYKINQLATEQENGMMAEPAQVWDIDGSMWERDEQGGYVWDNGAAQDHVNSLDALAAQYGPLADEQGNSITARWK
jgi:hypothetical protein